MPASVLPLLGLLVLSAVASVHSEVPADWTLVLVNQVKPCRGAPSYTNTLSVFPVNRPPGGDTIPLGTIYPLTKSSLNQFGLVGIQENGLYCRSAAGSGCCDPDNSGMMIIPSDSDCSVKTDKPWCCGQDTVERTENIVDWASSGTFPNCVLTLTRKANAPDCQTDPTQCPDGRQKCPYCAGCSAAKRANASEELAQPIVVNN